MAKYVSAVLALGLVLGLSTSPGASAQSYFARMTGGMQLPPTKTSAVADVALTIVNPTLAQLVIRASGIGGAYMAHIHSGSIMTPTKETTSPIAWLYNSTAKDGNWQLLDLGDVIFTTSFNPTSNGVLAALTAGTAFADFHSVAFKSGIVRGVFNLVPSDLGR